MRLRCGRGACRQEEGAAEVGRRGCSRGACRQEEQPRWGAAEVHGQDRGGCSRSRGGQTGMRPRCMGRIEEGAADPEVGRRGCDRGAWAGSRRVQPRWADGGAAEVHVGRRRVQPRWADRGAAEVHVGSSRGGQTGMRLRCIWAGSRRVQPRWADGCVVEVHGQEEGADEVGRQGCS